ncbi:hypothetical protein EWM64_g5620 [Hericium alpestre]|uniref:BTB domain-containing protein n=1 Tax=Hericium alpestre TaxID=135208 RepID=A0A4Y9ZWU9_9AGAM|nr:hypothetical protein EWM64_g5620 [Hericium alpestre]
MLTQPPAKRPREDDSEALAWTRHPDLWLARGDIVLVCDATGFCASQCILALNSTVFQDMFATVDPAQNEVFEGLSVVRLQDSAEEMSHLLKAMHFRQYIQKKSKPAFKVLAAVLKLSTKYMIDDLREEIVDTLASIFPSTFASWSVDKRDYLPGDTDEMYAVELAKTYNIPIMLPMAFYISCFFTLKEIVHPTTSAASNETRWACAIFRDDLMGLIDKALKDNRAAEQWLFQKALRCSDGNWRCAEDSCVALIDESVREHENKLRRLVVGDVLSPLVLRQYDGSQGPGCQTFKDHLRQYWVGMQKRIWDALPSLCGFKDWAAVEAAQAASMATKTQENSSTSDI